MPLGVIKISEKILKRCVFAESDYSGPLGFCEKLTVGAFSMRNHRFPLHFLAVPWKKDKMGPLWEKDTEWEPMGLGELTMARLEIFLAKLEEV